MTVSTPDPSKLLQDAMPALTTPSTGDLPLLTVEGLKRAGREFGRALSAVGIEELYGVDNGKTVGTYVEATFNLAVEEQFRHRQGNAAKGIDFPDVDVDLKVTSIKQPQSSCPFRDATQKVYGLGYHLLVFVYDKADDPQTRTARLKIMHVIFIDKAYSADFGATKGILDRLRNGEGVDEIDAYLEERNLPVDEIGRRQLAERIVADPPKQGYLTISNALQWRLQYGRAIDFARSASTEGPEDILAEQ